MPVELMVFNSESHPEQVEDECFLRLEEATSNYKGGGVASIFFKSERNNFQCLQT